MRLRFVAEPVVLKNRRNNSFRKPSCAIFLARAMYLVYDDGAELPYTLCPECCEEAYIMEEQRCALCGHEATHDCVICGNSILPEELVYPRIVAGAHT